MTRTSRKNNSFIILLFLFSAGAGYSQDTILVNKDNTVYMIFPEALTLVDVGLKDDYHKTIENDALFVKAVSNDAPVSTLLVRYKDDYRFFYIKGSEKVENYFYDYRKQNGTSENGHMANTDHTSSGFVEHKSVIKHNEEDTALGNQDMLKEKTRQRTGHVCGLKNENRSLGVKTNNLAVGVTVIRNDRNYTYLKILLQNKTSIEYDLDFISFQYVQKMKKGFLMKNKKNIKDVFPEIEPELKVIPANSVKALGYAIPVYALANKGYLIVSFREKKGDRVLKIKIQSEVIQKSPVIDVE